MGNWEGFERKRQLACLRFYFGKCLGGLRKTVTGSDLTASCWIEICSLGSGMTDRLTRASGNVLNRQSVRLFGGRQWRRWVTNAFVKQRVQVCTR